jgi:hypothetical protein
MDKGSIMGIFTKLKEVIYFLIAIGMGIFGMAHSVYYSKYIVDEIKVVYGYAEQWVMENHADTVFHIMNWFM